MTTGNAQLELLAPAGDDECLRAAVANGADAVYFGLEDFNARRRARNFTLGGLPEMMHWLHHRNVKGYVAFNTLVFSDELERAGDVVRGIIEAGADAIIVQDLGLARLIRRLSPTFPVHASTQMTQTHADGLAVLRDEGISRAILARELSLAQIEQISARQVVALEVFVHGAMCVSYSGQCLASESLWGRSGNRGLCGQACRLPYQLIVDGKPAPQDRGVHLLSPHDLAAYDRIDALVCAGVTAFKIEGRLKDAQYVALTTALYREAIDAAIANRARSVPVLRSPAGEAGSEGPDFAPFVLSPQRAQELAQSFSRGSTCGFLDGDRHQELIGAESPRNRGFCVGTVVRRTPGGIVIRRQSAVRDAIKPGDGVVFATDDPEQAQGGRVYSAKSLSPNPSPHRGEGRVRGETPADSTLPRPLPEREGGYDTLVELTFGRGDLDLAQVAIGSEVFKTDDPVIRRRIESSFARDRVVRSAPISASVHAVAGERLLLTFSDGCGHEAYARSDETLDPAERHSVTVEAIREQLSRLGDTPFSLAQVTLTGASGPADALPVMVPRSVLNELRRRAAKELMDLRERASRHAIVSPDPLGVMRNEFRVQARGRAASDEPVRLHVLARNLEQFTAACEAADEAADGVAIGTVYADFSGRSDQATALQMARQHGVRLGLATTQVLKPGDERLLESSLALQPDLLLVRNLTALRHLHDHCPATAWVADFSLNVVNDVTASMLAEAGAARITPGYDLSIGQLTALVSAAPAVPFELIAHAHVPMLHMAHCVAAASLSSGNDCRDCGRPCARHVLHLRDRNGEDHPVRVDAAGRTTIFNSRPQSLAACRRIPASGAVRHWRVELLDEDRSATRRLVNLYRRMLGEDPSAVGQLRRSVPGMVAGTFEHA